MNRLIDLFKNSGRFKVSRRSFLKFTAMGAVITAVHGLFGRKAIAGDGSYGRPKKGLKGRYDLVMADGGDPYLSTVKAMESMGGMEQFVKKNDTVVIKPNIGWDRTPEQAANTNPRVIQALIELAYKAGAKKVKVFDITCNDARRCYDRSGIQAAAREKGAFVFFPDDWNVLKARFKYPSQMEGWPVLKDAIECDVFVNVPVLKHHGLTGLTLSMKNLMGACGGSRGNIHVDIGSKLVDLTGFINPDLTVIDAHKVLIKNGPSGGNLADVRDLNKLIVATDPTLADAFACRLLNIDPLKIPYIKEAADRGFGSIDFNKARTMMVKV